MNALRTVWRLSRYRLALFSATALLASAHTTLSLGPGLIFKEFFDALTGEAPVHFGVWTLVALYAAVKMVDMVATIGEEVFRALVVGYVRALLQWNLFGVILRSPPTRERYTSGDMLNRFDEDVDQIVQAVCVVESLGRNDGRAHHRPHHHAEDQPPRHHPWTYCPS